MPFPRFNAIDFVVTRLSKNSEVATRILKRIFKAKIYDCIIFFNELDLLEIRINILDPYIDYFVIVEATKSHAGKPKPLYYQENSRRYEKFKDKIIHIIVDDMPDLSGNATRHDLATYHRNQIKKGLTKCSDSDIIIVSDADEIPNPDKIPSMIVLLNTFWRSIFFRQKMHYYYLNGLFHPSHWYGGTVACKYSNFRKYYKLEADKVRPTLITPERVSLPFIREGGWHFSYLGGPGRIVTKISSFEMAGFDKDVYKKNIQEKIDNGEDLYGREDCHITYIQIDNSYPKYILENIARYKHIIKDL